MFMIRPITLYITEISAIFHTLHNLWLEFYGRGVCDTGCGRGSPDHNPQLSPQVHSSGRIRRFILPFPLPKRGLGRGASRNCPRIRFDLPCLQRAG